MTIEAMADDRDAVPTSSPPSLEVETLRERLLTQVGGGGGGTRGSLSRCGTKFSDFVNKVVTTKHDDSSLDTDDIRISKQDLEREVKLYRVEMRKIALMAQAAYLEGEACDRSQQELNASVQECQAAISELQKTWTHEKTKRRNREEYEALAKLANNRPPRRLLQAKLASVQKEMDNIENQERIIEKEIATREKQFQLLLQCMFDLKSSLKEREGVLEEVDVEGRDINSGDGDEEGIVPMDTDT